MLLERHRVHLKALTTMLSSPYRGKEKFSRCIQFQAPPCGVHVVWPDVVPWAFAVPVELGGNEVRVSGVEGLCWFLYRCSRWVRVQSCSFARVPPKAGGVCWRRRLEPVGAHGNEALSYEVDGQQGVSEGNHA